MKIHKLHTRFMNGLGRVLPAQTKVAAMFIAMSLPFAGALSQVQAQTYTLSNAWNVANGTADITTSDLNRSLAYGALSNQVYVVNKGTPAIDVFNGASGAFLGIANIAGVTGGNFLLDQAGVADDGVVYACNLSTTVNSNPFKLYRWDGYANAPTVAFSGDPSSGLPLAGLRMGDNLAIKGSGTSTVILAPVDNGVTPTTNVVLFSTTDGINFANTIVGIVGLPAPTSGGGPVIGVTFYTNNTFLIKPAGASVYLVQYPANFAASAGTMVTATVISTNALSGNNVVLNCNPSAGLTAVYGTIPNAAPTTVPVSLYGVPPVSGFATVLAATNTAHLNANGNFAGAVALGGAGKTNFIYTLDCNNGVAAFAIYYTAAPQAPGIITQPVGGTGYAPFTLTVTANGAQPLYYQWQVTNTAVAGSFTNIPGATTNFYSVTNIGTAFYQVVITNSVNAVTSSVVQVTALQAVTSTVVTQLWRIPAGTYSYLSASDNNTRGLGYDTNSQRLVVSSISGGTAIYILDANTGTNIGNLNMSGVSGGTFALDQVKVADDGVVYAGNLVTSGSGFTLYRWPAPTNGAAATQAYLDSSGDLGGFRWGDTMAVRGSGTGTQILLASLNTSKVVLFTTTDGLNFTPVLISLTGVPSGFAAQGITFGAGNTLWGKASAGHLYCVSFDPVGLTGSVLLDYPNPGSIPTYQVGVAVDPDHNIMAGVDLSDTPDDLKLYQLTGTSDAPVLFNQSFFASANANANATVAIAMKYPRVFALDVNNGIIGLSYGVPPTTPASVTVPPASQTTYTNNPAVIFGASVSGSLPLYYQWQFSTSTNGGFADIPNATNSTYTIAYPSLSAAGYYQLVVHNIGGYATSTPPTQLTVIVPVTSTVVTQLWTIPGGGSLSFLDGSSYSTRGMAYDPVSSQVIVADHNNIHLLNSTNGNYLGDLNAVGIAAPGYSGWLFDQVGVADDGTLYAGNLAGVSGSGLYSIVSWAPGYGPGSAASAYAYGGGTGGDPGSGSGDRWGDTMAVRGSGTGTEILIGSYTGTNVVLFTTSDGTTFTPNLIAITNVSTAPGFSGQGIAFGAGDTFWAKSPGYNLRLVAFDRTTTPWTGGTIQMYTAGVDIPSSLGGIGVDVSSNVLGGVNFADTPNDLQLFLLSGNTNAPALFNQAFFGSDNLNSQENSVTTLKGGMGFSLNVNNGITAVSYGTPAAPSVQLTSVAYAPGNVTINWNNTFNGHKYQVQQTASLNPASWTNLGAPVSASGPTAFYTDNSAGGTTRFYRVISQ